MYPDGVETEQSSGYHFVAFRQFDGFLQTAKALRTLPPAVSEIRGIVEKMANYTAYAMDPLGFDPLNSDSDMVSDAAAVMDAAAEFDRSDWLYLATGGAQGRAPTGPPGAVFEWSGQVILRSSWSAGAQSHWTWFDVGPFGSSGHGHYDRLHLSIRSAQTPLLVDSGRFAYDGELAPYREEYGVKTPGHNVILLDGCGQAQGVQVAKAPIPSGSWGLGTERDYAFGSASFDTDCTKRAATHTRGLVHRRAGELTEFWVVVDRLEGAAGRTATSLWHAHPNASFAINTSSQLRAELRAPSAGLDMLLAVRSAGDHDSEGWKASIVRGQNASGHLQGWYSRTYGEKQAADCLELTGVVPSGPSFTMAWLIVPVSNTAASAVLSSSNAESATVTVALPGRQSEEVVVPMGLRNKADDADQWDGARLGAPSSSWRGHASDKSGSELPCDIPPLPVPLPAELPPEIEALLATTRARLDAMFEKSGATGGTASVVYGDRLLLLHSYGNKSAASSAEPVDEKTVFRIGSVTKVFTDLMLFRLEEEGALTATDPITTLAPEYKPRWPNGAVPTPRAGTLRDLASHMAGLPRGLPCDSSNCTVSTSQMIDVMNNWTLLDVPGTSLTYSNVGFAFLGRLLERVKSPTKKAAGETWEESIKALAQTLAMYQTSSDPPLDRGNLAYGSQWGQDAPLMDLGWGSPCGSVYTTAADMAKMSSFLLRDGAARDDSPGSGQPMDSASVRRWLTDRVKVNPSNLHCSNCIEYTEWGAPWHIMRGNTSIPSRFHILTKGGGIVGYDAFLALQPELKLGIFAAMSTGGGPAYAPFYDDVPEILAFDVMPPLHAYLKQHQPSRLPPNPPEYVGNFSVDTTWGRFTRTNYLLVQRADGPHGNDVLYARGSGNSVVSLVACNADPDEC